MAFINITPSGGILGAVTAAMGLLQSASDTYRAAIQDQTPEGRATLKFFVELMALPLAILTKLNGALHIDPLQLPAADPAKKGIAGAVDPAEEARTTLAQLLEMRANPAKENENAAT